MTGELSPLGDGIPVVADSTTRDARYPLATRVQDQRVFNKTTGNVERWSGSAWVTDIAGTGGVVLTFNVKAEGAAEDGSTNDAAAIQSAITKAQAVRGRVLFTEGKSYRVSTPLTVTGTVDLDLNGATLLCDVTGPTISAINASDATRTFKLHGGVMKWYGTFGTSVAGGVYLQDYESPVITDMTFNGLGAAVFSTGFNTNVVFASNKVVEHGASDMVSLGRSGGGLNPTFGITIADNFFQYTSATWRLHDCITGSFRHLTLRNNAFESARTGVVLGSAIGYHYLVDNDYFENCITDIVVGQDFGTGFYSSNLNGKITRCTSSTGASTFCRIDGNVVGLEIENNSMDGTVAGISVVNHRNINLRIGRNRGTAPSRLSGFPNLTSVVQGNFDVRCLDPMNDGTEWSKAFDPTATGALSTVAGLNGNRALQSVVTGGQLQVLKTIPSVDLSAVSYFIYRVWISDPTKLIYAADTGGSVWNCLSFGQSGSNFYYFPMQLYASGKSPVLVPGWNSLLFKRSDAIASGSPTWTGVVEARFTNFPDTAQTVTMKAGGLFAVTLLEDDYADADSLLARASVAHVGASRIVTGKAPQVGGLRTVGDMTVNAVPAIGAPIDWRTSVSGSPGTTVTSGWFPGSSADNGDANASLVATSAPTQRFDTVLTANRTCTLPLNAVSTQGQKFRIVRTGLGAFTLTVQDTTPTTVKVMPAGTAAFVDAEFNGTAWKLTAYGTL